MNRICRHNIAIIVAVVSLVVLSVAIPAAAQRVVPPVEKVTDFRPIGSLRMWTFTYYAKDMGRLFSTVTGEREVAGNDCLVIERRLSISYELMGSDREIAATGESFISPEGYYRGDNLTIVNDSLTERLVMEWSDDTLSGFFTRMGSKVEREVPLPDNRFGWDPNFVDQVEIILARHRLAVGETITDTIYQPQAMATAFVRGSINDFQYKQLYKGKFDSVFVVHLDSPVEADCFVTPDHRLVRFDFVPQRIRVYQDLVTQTDAIKEQAGRRDWSFNPSQLPHWILFLIVGGLGVLFWLRGRPSIKPLAIAIATGIVIFFVTLITQVPLQTWLAESFLEPGVDGRQWSFLGAVWPALAGGVIQEVLKLAGVILLTRLLRPTRESWPVLGAALAAAFGFFEAAYRLGYFSAELLSWQVLENAFWILFHATSGMLYGIALQRAGSRFTLTIVGMVLLNTVLRYVPIFAQRQALDVGLLNLLTALVILIFVVAILLWSRGQHRSNPGAAPRPGVKR
ncbi:hypothetical protein GF420_02085 [candidate division GN15 bacterium]|nr:hypothetical protein [candidate division GN15 bacterium]